MTHTLDHAARFGLAKLSVDFFFNALEQDCYPDESIEGCFGVKMGDNVGQIVFNAWVTLVKLGVATRENITAALVTGSLAEVFETLVRDHNCSSYTHELASRDLFGSIPWDDPLHKIISSGRP